jgi:crotonobetainyl-CoA:carnitine CoA-transferase CaiB-like acyl-CoA transferase
MSGADAAAEMKSAVQDLRIVDFGFGMSAALVAKQFAELGAHVSRIEPESGDPFYDVYPAYQFWRRRAVLERPECAAKLLENADLCIIGGEDFPGLAHERDAEALSRRYPKLIVLRLTGYPDDDDRARPAVDLLAQARTGMVYEQFSQRPIAAAFPLPSYGAALQGLIGAWVALIERERSGRGQIVTSSLAAGAAMFWGPFWMKAEKADAGFTGITPRDVRHLILRCAGDEYVQITLGVPGAVAKVYTALGIPDAVDPNDRGMPDHTRGPANFFGYFDLLNAYAQRHSRPELVQALRAAGVPAEAVLPPGESWDEEQTRLNGVIETYADGWCAVGSPLRITPTGEARPIPARLAAYDPGAPPLAGVRVVDFGIFVAGPYASKLLADYGADVIQVEPPTGRATLSGERTIISANHGKRSICLDAKSEQGRRIVAKLCEGADIVLHNFRLGLDRKTLRALNPALVTLETTAYGSAGPKAAAPGFDMVIQAHCGLQHRAGGAGNPPLCSRAPLVDFAAGAVGCIGMLVGLHERLRTGRTLSVETNLLNVGTHMMLELVRTPENAWLGAPPVDTAQTGSHPAESLYPTSDGWVAISARSNAMAAALADLLDIEMPADRAAWGAVERARLAERTLAWTNAALLESLEKAGVWAEACVRDAWDQRPPDGAILRKMQDAVYGEVVHCIGPLIAFSRSKTISSSRLSTPPGADGKAILADLAATNDKICSALETGALV